MPDETLRDNAFIVRESRFVDFLFSFLFFAMFVGALATIHFELTYSLLFYRNIAFSTIIPSLLFLANGIRNRIIIEVNAVGIFYKGNLITSWKHFVIAYITQEEIPGSLDDNFRIMIEYNVPEQGINYIYKLKMSSTQNKSEEQIIAAIQEWISR